MILRWRKHPLDLHPGDPIVIERHEVRGRKIKREEDATVDAPPANDPRRQISADMVRIYWHDLAGRTGVTIYHPAQWIHLRKTA